MAISKEKQKACLICGKEFIAKDSRIKTCSRSCGGKLGNTKKAREKAKLTKAKLYGDENYNNRKKYKQTIREKYGEDFTNVAQVPEIKDKIIDTYTQRHGGMGAASQKVREKQLEGLREKHNDDTITNVYQIPEVKQKIKDVHQERYGGLGFASEELSQKSKDTFKERYNEDLYNSPKRAKLVQKALLEKYGVNSPMLIPGIKEKAIESYVKNNGGMGGARDSVKEKLEETLTQFVDLYESGEYDLHEIAEIMEKSLGTIQLYGRKLGYQVNLPNKLNETWKYFLLKETGVDFDYEGAIYTNPRKKVDLYNDDLKIAIEINPTITHSTQATPLFRKKVHGTYHQERAIDAEKNGWLLIQIFDWDDPMDIVKLIKYITKDTTKIYARKCKVQEISKHESTRFLEENHRQGARAREKIAYGLFYDDELVQVMTFSKERFKKSNVNSVSYELLRLASKSGVNVVGGASKLLNAFVNSDYKPIEIKSFVDYSKGQGKVYERIGMTFEGLAALNGIYANIHTGEALKVTTVSQKYSKEYKRLGQTQQEYMNSKHFYRINDAGNKIYKWVKSSE